MPENKPTIYKIKGLGDDHPAQKEFNKFMQEKSDEKELTVVKRLKMDNPWSKVGFHND